MFRINHDSVPEGYDENERGSTGEEFIRHFISGLKCDSCGGSIDCNSAIPPVVGWSLSDKQLQQLNDGDFCTQECSKIYYLHAKCAYNGVNKINYIFPLEKFWSRTISHSSITYAETEKI